MADIVSNGNKIPVTHVCQINIDYYTFIKIPYLIHTKSLLIYNSLMCK